MYRVKDECLLMCRDEGQEKVSVYFHRIKPRNTFVQICCSKSSFIMLGLIREKKEKIPMGTEFAMLSHGKECLIDPKFMS